MACFLVPTVEAVVLTVVNRQIKKKEQLGLQAAGPADPGKVYEGDAAEVAEQGENRIPWSRKIGWLTNLLWGGAFLLLFEHVWHGEVVPWPPFLTAMNNAADTAEMLHEMSTVGVTMAIIVTAVWFVMTLVADALCKWSNALAEERR